MRGQLRLLDVEPTAPRLSAATIEAGRRGLAECREVLAKALDSLHVSLYGIHMETTRGHQYRSTVEMEREIEQMRTDHTVVNDNGAQIIFEGTYSNIMITRYQDVQHGQFVGSICEIRK